MEIKKKSKKQKQVKTRNNYTADHREKALKYYLMGLSLSEIGKLLDGVPVRTLEKWQISGKWTTLKDTENIKVRALQLHESGKTYQEVADILQVNRVTVWRYIKQAKAEKK